MSHFQIFLNFENPTINDHPTAVLLFMNKTAFWYQAQGRWGAGALRLGRWGAQALKYGRTGAQAQKSKSAKKYQFRASQFCSRSERILNLLMTWRTAFQLPCWKFLKVEKCEHPWVTLKGSTTMLGPFALKKFKRKTIIGVVFHRLAKALYKLCTV